ncbi:MAG TPA: hypothetical protein PKH69_02245 [Thiobacillaceae bacterium]|nr:hypothetical protein [Thiobacillaceae bacterium]HNU62907.1 hypothetical protein [Thiobacillaceae bacterium]
MLIALVAATLVALLAGQALPKVIAAAPAFWAHIVLAMGVMTLITAAMQHFVPVLARTRGASPHMARLPLLMLLAGSLAVLALGGWIDFYWVSVAALLGLVGMAVMVAWMLDRARQALGRPHPGLNWYGAAMVCLGLALAAALMIPLFPDWYHALRAFHLHLNLYGFVGLTAVGTLQVLMPTAAGQADPQAALRLRQDLKWALGGALAIAIGQAAWPVLAWLGVALWIWVMGRMGWAWWGLHRARILSLHGAEPVLAAAWLGYVAALIGVLQDQANPLAQFLPAFLMPLVTGAAGVLAPVWLNPARPASHATGRQALNRWGSVRAVFFLVAGILPLLGYQCAGMPALTALIWFGILFAVWLYYQ